MAREAGQPIPSRMPFRPGGLIPRAVQRRRWCGLGVVAHMASLPVTGIASCHKRHRAEKSTGQRTVCCTAAIKASSWDQLTWKWRFGSSIWL